MGNSTDVSQGLSDAIQDFIHAIAELSEALKNCREAGLNIQDMHETIMESIPEEDKPAFAQQWPMISMLLSAL